MKLCNVCPAGRPTGKMEREINVTLHVTQVERHLDGSAGAKNRGIDATQWAESIPRVSIHRDICTSGSDLTRISDKMSRCPPAMSRFQKWSQGIPLRESMDPPGIEPMIASKAGAHYTNWAIAPPPIVYFATFGCITPHRRLTCTWIPQIPKRDTSYPQMRRNGCNNEMQCFLLPLLIR